MIIMVKPVTPPGHSGEHGGGKPVTDAGDDFFSFISASPSVTEYVIAKESLLYNDTAKFGSLSITSAQGIDGARVEIDPQGNLHVFAANSFDPDATFTYTVTDRKGATDTATVTVHYTAGNQPPVAADDYRYIPPDSPDGSSFGIAIPFVLANDFDPDDVRLGIFGLGEVVGGTARIEPPNLAGPAAIVFTPDNGAPDNGSVEYIVGDGHGNYDTGLIVFG
jgi:hypothetical protein